MNHFKIWIASLFLLNGCTSEPKATNDPSVGSFSSGNPNEVQRKELPRPLSPEARKNSGYNPTISLSGVGTEAAIGAVLLGTLAGIGAITASPEKRTDLRGTCLYGDAATPAIATPCIHVTVNLLMETNKIVSSTTTNENGDFRFFIPSDESYWVQVIDRKGRNASLNKRVGRSDIISIFLKP